MLADDCSICLYSTRELRLDKRVKCSTLIAIEVQVSTLLLVY